MAKKCKRMTEDEAEESCVKPHRQYRSLRLAVVT